MNVLFSYLLLSLPIQGILWTLLLATLCFFGVHITALVKLGWKYKMDLHKKREENAPTQATTTNQNSQAPVYYIVEKTKRRPKGDYAHAKPFQFKEP